MCRTVPVPVEVKAVRVLLFVITGIGLALFAVLIIRGADQTTLATAYAAYIGQAFLTHTLALLIAPGRTWLIYALCAYAVVAMAFTLITILAGDLGAATQLLLPGLILYLTLRPDARRYLRGHTLH